MLQTRKSKLWWAEVEGTTRLGLPIMTGMVSQTMMGLTDTIMVGHLGVVELAAASFVMLIVFPPMTFVLGLLSGVAVLTAQGLGAKRNADCGEALRNGLLISLCAGLLFPLGGHLILSKLHILGQSPAVMRAAENYLVLFAWSMVPALIAHAAKQFSEALNKAWVPNAILFAGVLLNIFFNWILIYGNLGSPALGLEGAGWATLLARVCMALGLLGYVLCAESLSTYRPANWLSKFQRNQLAALFRIGTPSAVQHLLEVGAFAVAGIMMGWISSEVLAAHQIAITCASTTFTLAVGLGMGVCIRIGHAWGAGKLSRIRRTGIVGFTMVGVMMGVFGVIFATGRYPLARAFISDPNVVAIVAQLFLVAALFQVVDGLQVMGLSTLRGISDVRVPAMVAVLAYWIVALPIGYALAFHTKLGATGMWLGLALGLATAALILARRFLVKTRSF